ncbi:hypothetical protein [Gryllotalpicola protaetiae]|nr:hypothetical protein [Gryllotalpicola protaetiae]
MTDNPFPLPDEPLLPSDYAFTNFIATVTAKDLSPYEWALYQYFRLHA